MGDYLFLAIISLVIMAVVSILAWLALQQGQKTKQNYQSSFEKTASANLADMFLFVDAGQLFSLNMVVLAVTPLVVYLFTGSLFLVVLVCLLIIVTPGFVYKTLHKKRMKNFEKQLPDALVMLSGGMRAGASFSVSLESVVKAQYPPLNQEFELFLRQVRVGVDFDEALTNMVERMPTPDFQLVVSAIRIAREVGGNLGEILESLAETIRRKQTMEGKIEGLTAQGKIQGVVMTALPVLLAMVLFWLDPVGMKPLLTTPIGWATSAVVLSMLGLGYFFISRVTNIDV